MTRLSPRAVYFIQTGGSALSITYYIILYKTGAFLDLHCSVYNMFINCARIYSHISKCYALMVFCYEVVYDHKQ